MPRQRLGAQYQKLFVASAVTNLGDGVGLVAYPWLASAVTRNPVLITTIVVAQRVPWLVFSLPAGVITDRVDRRRLIIAMDTCRGVLTALVAVAVSLRAGRLPAPDAVASRTGTEAVLYLVVVAATLLLGTAEVLRDNAAQTLMPALVPAAALEAANGRLWSVESVANNIIGPPLGSLLLAGAFALPVIFDAGSFFAAAALIALIPGRFAARGGRAGPATGAATGPATGAATSAATGPAGFADRAEGPRPDWRADLAEGVRWLWRQPVLRSMALILGLMNLAGTLSVSVLVLFVQDVLHEGATTFAVIGMGGAVGAVIGGAGASALSRRLGGGTCLAITLVTLTVTAPIVGLARSWPVVFAMFALDTAAGTLWNVITVSLRQTVIPDNLLGRVNSAYRFVAWGMMPLGALAGGGVVALVTALADRTTALRSVWFVNGAAHLVLLVVVRRLLTNARLDDLRAQAAGRDPPGAAG